MKDRGSTYNMYKFPKKMVCASWNLYVDPLFLLTQWKISNCNTRPIFFSWYVKLFQGRQELQPDQMAHKNAKM